MAFQIRKAKRTQVAPKIAISGPSGAGKTLSALMIAYGITKDWSKILVIDTENNSSELYAKATIKNISKVIGQFDVIEFEPPYSPQRYCEAVLEAVKAGKYQVIIIDSLSHSWNATGGALDMVNNSNEVNSYAKWKYVTPAFNKMINTILQAKCTIICTLRAKQGYVMETNDRGKQVPKKVGLEPIIRDGIEFEFTTVFDMNLDHYAMTSKDRTGIFSGQIVMDDAVGILFEEWRMSGSPIVREYAPELTTFSPQPTAPPAAPPSFGSEPTPPPQVAPPSFNQAPPQMNAPAAPPVMTQPQPPVNNAAPEFTTDHQKVLGEIMDIATRAGLTTGEQLKALSSKAFNTPDPKSSKAMTIDELKFFKGFLDAELNKQADAPSNVPLF